MTRTSHHSYLNSWDIRVEGHYIHHHNKKTGEDMLVEAHPANEEGFNISRFSLEFLKILETAPCAIWEDGE